MPELKQQPETEVTEAEVVVRRDAAILRALSTPHKKQMEMKIGNRKKKADPPKGEDKDQ